MKPGTKRKIQIHWNHDKEQFEIAGKQITFEKAKSHWMACDADWSMGAYNKMIDLTLS